MRARWARASAAILTLVLVGAGWLTLPVDGGRAAGSSAASLVRSDEVVQAKIARKKDKLENGSRRPDHPDEAGEFRRMLRRHPEGESVTELQMQARDAAASMPPVSLEKDAGIWDWEWLGPGNIGGRVRAILTHPTDPDILWIGSASGGIWKSTNGGDSWYPLWDFMSSLSITALVMDPTNPDIIYAATGEGFTWMPPGAGIFKSYNGGGTWTQLTDSVDPENHRWINDLIIDPDNPKVLLAAAKTDVGWGRIIRSDDGGDSWDTMLIQQSSFTDLAMDPDNPDIVLASTLNSVFRSTQNGIAQSWHEISTGLAGGLPDNTGRTSFSFGVGNDMIYASLDVPIAEETPQGEVWRSSDNGATWEWRSTPLHLNEQGHYNNVIWLEPGSTDRVIIGGINLMKSYDGGSKFVLMSNWTMYHVGSSAHADQHVIVPDTDYGTAGHVIYVGNDGGIQKAIFGFDTQQTYGWVNLANNLGITQFYHADATPDGSIILGGTQDNDDLRYKRVQGAQAWYQAETGDGTYTAINPQNELVMYASYVRLQMQRSLDGGANYGWITNGLGDAGIKGRALFVAPFALDKIWPINLIAGGRSIWRSTDYGATWGETLGPRSGDPLCSAVEISPTEGSVVTWVGYTDGSIWRTEDIAASWQEVDHPDPGVEGYYHITDIEISPHDRNTVLVTYTGYDTERVWITRNNGATWTALPGTGDGVLPIVHTNCATFHPTDPNWIYVGTDVGIFASEDLGEHWSVISRYGTSEGPVYTEVSDLIWHSGDTLVAVTYGRGMYECRPLSSIYVNSSHGGTEDGSYQYPYDTVVEGYDAAGHGSTLILRDGDYDENGVVLQRKHIILRPEMGETAVIR